MNSDVAVGLMSAMLWATLKVSAPIFAAALLTGVLVSIVQVVTQVQEMSLTFIPKLLAVVFVLVLLGPWMLRQVASYSTGVITSIPSYF